MSDYLLRPSGHKNIAVMSTCGVSAYRHALCFSVGKMAVETSTTAWILWIVLSSIVVRANELRGGDLNSTSVVINVQSDPTAHWRYQIAYWKFFWSQANRGDMVLLTGLRAVSFRGMPSQGPCCDGNTILRSFGGERKLCTWIQATHIFSSPSHIHVHLVTHILSL